MHLLNAVSCSLATGTPALTGFATWKASVASIESSCRSQFDKGRAVRYCDASLGRLRTRDLFCRFVGFNPLDHGFRSLLSQSKNLWTMVVSLPPNTEVVVSPERLSGRWRKNAKLSDDTNTLYEYACLPWMLRKGERFLRYLEIQSDASQFRRTINAGGFLNVSEVYPWDGSSTRLKRRDMRGGKMQGHVEQTPTGAKTTVSWSDPHSLSMEDDFCLSEDGQQLTIYTTAKRPNGHDHVMIKQIFTKI